MTFFNQLTTSVKNETPKKVIAFYGPAGTGKSTLVVNIARTVQKESAYEPSICIIDLDFLFPTTSFKLYSDDLTPTKYNIGDVLEQIDALESDVFEGAISVHTPTGIHLFNHETDLPYDHRNIFTYEKINKLIDICKERFDLVFIDLPAAYREDAVNSGLSKADSVCFILTDSLSHVVHARKQLSILTLLEKSTDLTLVDKINIISNRRHPGDHCKKLAITDDTLKLTLYQRPILGVIHEKNDVSHHHNHGNFACDYNATFRKDIEKIARQLYPFDREDTKNETKMDLKRNKESWINLYGSEHLKNCTKYSYNCQRLYVEERANHEFKDWSIDFDFALQLGERSCPSPEALQMEIAIRDERNEDINVRVMWDKSKYEEVLVIEDYLEKYRLYKRMH